MIIGHVRMQSAAGYYLGSIEVINGEAEPYDRISGYCETEEWLKHEYPRSISLEEAFIRGRVR